MSGAARAGGARGAASRLGANRGAAVRGLVRLGNERLTALEARGRRQDPVGRALGVGLGWLGRGRISVRYGPGEGLWLDLAHLPISHPQLGELVLGHLETPVQEALRRHLPPGGVLYDVGANIGWFSLLGARLAGPQGRVYAFEPAPGPAAAVADHARLNGFANIEPISAAVTAAPGRARLQIVADGSWSKLAEYGAHPLAAETVEVEAVALDELPLRPPDVIKLDVEGAEVDALRGARRTLEEHRPVVICELHETHTAFGALMAELGYRLVNLEGTEALWHAPANARFLALPD